MLMAEFGGRNKKRGVRGALEPHFSGSWGTPTYLGWAFWGPYAGRLVFMQAMRDESLSKSLCKRCVFILSPFSPGFYATFVTDQIGTCVVSVVCLASSIVLFQKPVNPIVTNLQMPRNYLNSVPTYRLRPEAVETWLRNAFKDNDIHVEVSKLDSFDPGDW